MKHPVIFTIAILCLTLFTNQSLADNATPMTCQDHTIRVKLKPDARRTYTVTGTLCYNESTADKTLQILLSGGGYGPIYWDFTYEPETYSYVRAAVRNGFATFNLSRIGIGQSDHPRGFLVDIDANAYVVQQVIEYIQSAQSGIDAPKAIITVGHSMGSVMALAHAVTYPRAIDGTILTGFVHNVNPEYPTNIASASYFAPLDPRFIGKGYGWFYLTSKPGTRRDLFYNTSNADPEVIAIDEATKETLTASEIASNGDYYTDVSLAIQVPVLIVLGDGDGVGCGGALDCSDSQSVQDLEEAFFSAEACIETEVIENTGHNVNLHYSAPDSYASMFDWIARRIGSAATQPCGTP